MSKKLYRVWTERKDGTVNGYWDNASFPCADRVWVERLANVWNELLPYLKHEVREYQP